MILNFLRRAALRQRIRWAEQDLAIDERALKHLPDQIRLTRAQLSAMRSKEIMLAPRPVRTNRTLLVALGMAAAAWAVALLLPSSGAAAQSSWRHVADMSDGTTWTYNAASVGHQRFGAETRLAFVVQRVNGASVSTFKFSVRTSDCPKGQGAASIHDIVDDATLQSAFWRKGNPGDASALATTLCRVHSSGLA